MYYIGQETANWVSGNKMKRKILFETEKQKPGVKRVSVKRKHSETSNHCPWNSSEYKKKKKKKTFSARDDDTKIRKNQYIITQYYLNGFKRKIVFRSHKLSNIMVKKGSKVCRSSASTLKKTKKSEKKKESLDDDTPLSEIKKRQSAVQKKSRKKKVDVKRVSRTNEKLKKNVQKQEDKDKKKVNKKVEKDVKSKTGKVKDDTATDPRFVPLPDDASEVSELSDKMQKTNIEKRQEAESEEIELQYKKAMKKRIKKKEDAYKDKDGRLKDDEESNESTTSNNTTSSDDQENHMEVNEESDSKSESVEDVVMKDREDDSSSNSDKEGTVVEVSDADKEDDKQSPEKRKYAQVTQDTPQVTPEKVPEQKTDAQLLDEFIRRPRIHVQEDEDSDSGTVVQCNQKSKTKVRTMKNGDNTKVEAKRDHMIFCKCKIKIPESDTPTARMRKQLQIFLTTMIKVDRSAILYEYKDSSYKRYINHPSKIPERPSKIKSFFDGGYRPSAKGVEIWPQIKVGISVDPETFIADLRSLLEDQEMTVFIKDIQAEETEIIGYFLYSHGKQDRTRLKNTIENHLKRRCKIEECVSVRWQKVQNSIKGNGKDSDVIKAFHIEVVKGKGMIVGRGIAKLYSSRLKMYPDGEKMRFIRYKTGNQHSSEVATFQDIANKQNWFTQLTSYATTYEIASLNERYDGLSTSLRGYIMDMETSEGQKMFLTLDWNWNKSAVLMVFPTSFSDEARDRIADLASYMRFIAGDRALLKFFTPEAAERAVRAPWNKELGRAVSEEVTEFNDILEESGQIDWLQPQEEQVQIEIGDADNNENNQQGLFPFAPNDDTSLPSMGTYDTKSNGKRESVQEEGSAKKQKTSTENEYEEITVNSDDQTIQTLSERVNQMNRSQIQFQNSITNRFDSIMKALQGRAHNSEDAAHTQSETPVPREGTGATL